LAVTRLAKWKTTAQMIAIATLFAAMGLEYVREQALARNRALIAEMTETGIDNELNVLSLANIGGELVWMLGLALIWVAAALTAVTGWDYLKKAMPHLRDTGE